MLGLDVAGLVAEVLDAEEKGKCDEKQKSCSSKSVGSTL
jgi:hypothetical protein